MDVRDRSHHEPAVVAVDEALEELCGQVLLGPEDDLIGVASGGGGGQPASGVDVRGMDGAHHPVEARQVLVDVGPDPVEGLRIGDQHDPPGEDRPGEHPPVDEPPAEHRETPATGTQMRMVGRVTP